MQNIEIKECAEYAKYAMILHILHILHFLLHILHIIFWFKWLGIAIQCRKALTSCVWWVEHFTLLTQRTRGRVPAAQTVPATPQPATSHASLPRPPRACSCSRSSPFAVIGGGCSDDAGCSPKAKTLPLSLAFGLQPLSECHSGCHQPPAQPFAHKHYI